MSGPWEKYQQPDQQGPWTKYQEQPTDYKQIIGDSIKNMFQKPAAFAKDLGTNPTTMANMMPSALGMAGAMSPIPGGATMGTAMGQGVQSGALRLLGKKDQIPPWLEIDKQFPYVHGKIPELGLAALGDVAAIPAMKKSYYGGQIGKVEKAAGVPPPQDITSIPMAKGEKTLGEFINGAVDSVKGSQGRGTASYWKQIKDQIDRIYEMGAQEKLTGLDRGRLRWLNQQVQGGLNQAVPGRAGPAGALAQSQTIPNGISRVYRAIPGPMKAGAAYGTGATAAGISLIGLVKHLLGG